MRKIKLCIDRESLKAKPTEQNHIRAIKSRLHTQPYEIAIDRVADAVGNKGHTFYCGSPIGGKNEHWNGQQIVLLDYDEKGIDYNDVYNMFVEAGLKPTFTYKSLRYTDEHHKFRLVWALEELITDFRVAMSITKALIHFSETQGYKVDDASSKIAQMWYGGKGLLHTNFDDVLDLKVLFNTVVSDCLADENGHSSRRLKKLAKDLGVNTVNNIPQITPIEVLNEIAESTEKVIYDGLLFDFGVVDEKGKVKVSNERKALAKQIQIDLINNVDKCQLLVNMISGEHYNQYHEYNHKPFFGLATNLHNIKGAEQLYTSIVQKQPYTNKKNKMGSWKSSRKGNYKPMMCENFCPYHKECGSHNIISAIQGHKRFGVRKLADTPTIDVAGAREQLKGIMDIVYAPFVDDSVHHFKKFVVERNMTDTKKEWDKLIIHGVEIGTGGGKTYALKNRNLTHHVIALKTHALCQEFLDNNPNKEIHYVKPLNQSNMPQEMKAEIELRYMCKAGVNSYLEQQLEKHKDDLVRPEWCDDVEEYFECIEGIKKAKILLMTQRRLSYMYKLGNYKIHTLDFDEDPFPELLQLSSVDHCRAEDLLTSAFEYAKVNEEYHDIVKPIEDYLQVVMMTKEHEYVDTSKMLLDYKVISKIRQCMTDGLKHDIKQVYSIMPIFSYIAITRTKGDTDSIQGLVEHISHLPKLKTVIYSATLDERLMNMLISRFAPDRKYFHHKVQEIKHKGHLILHAGKTYSRSSVKDDTEYIERIAREHNLSNIITYKHNITQFRNRTSNTDIQFMNFGDCLGYNSMSGKDIGIVGTPSIPSWVYEIYGFALTGKLPQSTGEWKIKKITRNGFEFPLNTYTSDSDEVFTYIQLYFITSEIIQAVGRARLVNEDCTVHLYSNIPLLQCTIVNQ